MTARAIVRVVLTVAVSALTGVRFDRQLITGGSGAIRRRDWTLLALAAAGGSALTPVQLQKTLYVLGRELPQEVGPNYYQFRPYSYGPFSPRIYEDAEALARAGLVDVRQPARDRSWVTYAATPRGLEAAQKLGAELPVGTRKYIESLVKWARRLTFQQLVSAIYRKYPEQRANSIFVE